MSADNYDLVVIGGGPGGYVAAIRGAQLGLKVAIVEKESILGGTCLRVGCIPSKALLESSDRYHEAKHELAEHGVKFSGVEVDLARMMDRKKKVVTILGKGIDSLMKKGQIARLKGLGSLAGPGKVRVEGEDAKDLTAKHVIVATGSSVARLPGVELDGDRIGTSTEALSYPSIPGHLVVIGGGIIGLELGSVWLRLGSKVTVLEYLERILPGTDDEIADEALRVFKKQGFTFTLGARVTGARVKGETCVVEVAGKDPLECDRVLLAVGRVPNTEGLGLDALGIETDKRGRIVVDAHFETKVPGIYAIGDVIAGPMLAHKAEEEGVACVERIVTGYGHVNYDVIPGICYTNPEIATVGKTEEELKSAEVKYKKGVFAFRGNGRARSMGQVEGKVKVLAHADTDRVLGVHIFGPRAGDLIAEAAAAMEFGATSEDIARTCHAHPTLSETLKEASLAVAGRALHG